VINLRRRISIHQIRHLYLLTRMVYRIELDESYRQGAVNVRSLGLSPKVIFHADWAKLPKSAFW